MEDKFAVIIAGSRNFDDYNMLEQKCDIIFSRKKPTAIICGEAKGADSLGKRYAKNKDIEVLSFPADWNRYGKSAGYVRNKEMAQHADALVAFWDGRSKGTKNMIEIAQKMNLPIRVVLISFDGYKTVKNN